MRYRLGHKGGFATKSEPYSSQLQDAAVKREKKNKTRKISERFSGEQLLQLFTLNPDCFIRQRRHPKTPFDDTSNGLVGVFRAGVDQPQQVLDNECCTTVPLKVYKWLAAKHTCDKCRLLRIVSEIVDVECWSSNQQGS